MSWAFLLANTHNFVVLLKPSYFALACVNIFLNMAHHHSFCICTHFSDSLVILLKGVKCCLLYFFFPFCLGEWVIAASSSFKFYHAVLKFFLIPEMDFKKETYSCLYASGVHCGSIYEGRDFPKESG